MNALRCVRLLRSTPVGDDSPVLDCHEDVLDRVELLQRVPVHDDEICDFPFLDGSQVFQDPHVGGGITGS
jgi:hypothetical protein